MYKREINTQDKSLFYKETAKTNRKDNIIREK